MNRRQLLAALNPFRAVVPQAGGQTAQEARDALFRRAMAQGIDPATVDPERLEALLGPEEGGLGNTQQG